MIFEIALLKSKLDFASPSESVFKHRIQWSGKFEIHDWCFDQQMDYQRKYGKDPSIIVLSPKRYEKLIAEVSVRQKNMLTIPTEIGGMRIVVWDGNWEQSALTDAYTQYTQYLWAEKEKNELSNNS